MSTGYWFRGRLSFASESAIGAARDELEEGGARTSPDNPFRDRELPIVDRVLTLEERGWMPYTCLEIACWVLGTWARHAAQGELLVLYTQDGYGLRIPAGGEDEELEPEEVDALLEQWSHESGTSSAR